MRLLSKLIWTAVFLVICGGAAAQQHKIVDIRVTGNIHSSEKLVKNVAAFRLGRELSGSDVQDAVKNLYAQGIFKDISVDIESVTAGIVVNIIVSEYPILSSIAYQGNKKIKDKDIEELLRLAPGGYISDHLAIQAKKKIESEYMSKGYFLAVATPDIKYSTDSARADLIFRIKEYSKVKVDQVIITGAERLVANDIVKKMSNRKHGFLRSSDFRKEKYPEDKVKIIDYCKSKGYVDAYIKSDSFSIDTSINRMTIYIDLYEGPRYYFGKSTFSGNEIYTDEMLTKALKHQDGKVFNQEKYDESLGELYGAYQEEGYLHVRMFDSRQTHDSIIDIEYSIVEGLPSQIRMIEIIGNTKTKEKIIRREFYVRPGDTFRRSLLLRSLREVMQLNYFGDVVPDIRNLPSGDVDIIIKVEEKPTGQVSAGAGYSGQDKLVGTFTLGIPNFRGNGQNLSTSVDFGSRRNSVSIGFTEPWFMGTPTSVGVDIYNLNRRWYNDFTEGRRGGALRLGRRLRWPDNYFKIFWRYRLEDVKYYDFEQGYLNVNGDIMDEPRDSRYVPLESSLQNYNERWLRTSAMSFTIERDSRDLPMFATDGARISYTGELAGGILGGEWKYYKHLFNAQKFIPLYKKIALVGKFKFGYISATGNEKIPYSERFSPGGVDPDGMVRGYSDASLAKRGDNGAYLRGISEVIYNLELQIPLVEGQIYLLGFADAGKSWIRRPEIEELYSKLAKGAGVGFRLVVPGIGVIGFDFGYAFDDVYGETKGWKPHFQVGQGF